MQHVEVALHWHDLYTFSLKDKWLILAMLTLVWRMTSLGRTCTSWPLTPKKVSFVGTVEPNPLQEQQEQSTVSSVQQMVSFPSRPQISNHPQEAPPSYSSLFPSHDRSPIRIRSRTQQVQDLQRDSSSSFSVPYYFSIPTNPQLPVRFADPFITFPNLPQCDITHINIRNLILCEKSGNIHSCYIWNYWRRRDPDGLRRGESYMTNIVRQRNAH